MGGVTQKKLPDLTISYPTKNYMIRRVPSATRGENMVSKLHLIVAVDIQIELRCVAKYNNTEVSAPMNIAECFSVIWDYGQGVN